VAYRVNLTSRAQRDLILLFDDIHADTSDAAARWYAGLKAAILSLERKPNRCSIVPENKAVRHLLYGHKPNIYRVIYRVREKAKQVDVLHIRHGARRSFRARDVR
jgi:plasmid stabilization system protein ParE